MKYEQMVEFLRDHPLEDLAIKIGIPTTALNRFLRKNGFTLSEQQEVPRPRVNPLGVLAGPSPFTGQEMLTGEQKEIVIGSLYGDTYAGRTSEGVAYLRCEHAWGQIGYLNALYELLRPFSFSPYLDKPQKGNQDWQVGFTCHASKQFGQLWEAFYTVDNGSKHLQKDTFGPTVDWLTPLAIAVWLMDDGKRYGAAFSLTVGKEPHYTRKRFEDMCFRLNARLRTDFKVAEERNAFNMYVTKGSRVIEMIRDFVLPDFAYKIGIAPEDCGAYYRGRSWYGQWQGTRRNLVHPLLDKSPYSRKFYLGLSGVERARYEKALFCQVRARGFPFFSRDRRDIAGTFEKMKLATVTLDGDTLVYDHSYNCIPNAFMDHRLKLRVKGHKSPYEVFLNNKELMATLVKQLRDGPALNNSNIRAALSVYRTQVVGQFNPLYAKFFCEKYCPEGGTVLDPCAGFGARMVGCAAAGRTYVGIEPSVETVHALGALAAWLRSRSSAAVSVVKGCAERLPVKKFDMALTSPPYFDKEEYAYDDNQSFMRYPEYSCWVEGFLRPLVSNVFLSLRPGSVFVLNIDGVDGRGLCADALRVAADAGFVHESTFWSGYLRRPAGSPSREPYYMFRRPL